MNSQNRDTNTDKEHLDMKQENFLRYIQTKTKDIKITTNQSNTQKMKIQ